jgi:hypothetical protein
MHKMLELTVRYALYNPDATDEEIEAEVDRLIAELDKKPMPSHITTTDLLRQKKPSTVQNGLFLDIWVLCLFTNL